jgi:DNA-binding response OmpR family regulator
MSEEETHSFVQGSPARDISPGNGAPRVLLAEDDAEMRSLLEHALRSEGYDITTRADGIHLVASLCSKEMACFDLIVADALMLGVNGLDSLKSLAHQASLPPVILITARGDDATHAEAKRLGAAAIFDKPFNTYEFLVKARELVPSRSVRP